MIFYSLTPRQEVIDAAHSVGAKIVPVANAEFLSSLESFDGETVEVHDPLDALSVVRALEPFVSATGEPGNALCVGLGDDTSQVAALVNSALGLAEGKCASFTSLEIMRDKHRLREALPEGSPINGLHWMIDLTTGTDSRLQQLFLQTQHGLVLKPNSGSGSRDVRSVVSEAELQDLAVDPGQYLVEQRFVGPEFSVETISWAGQHRPLVVTEKLTGGITGLVETGHHQPARISEESRNRLFDAARTVLDSANYQFGLSHIEFILEDGQPRLIEAHGRVGGDHIADLMEWSVGATAFDILFSAYQHQRLPNDEPRGEQSAVFFPDLSECPHTDEQWLTCVRQHEDVKDAGVMKAAGDRGPITCSADRHAYVILSGQNISRTVQSLQSQKVLP
ncbi:ATP-grasp domain-containing protein [Brevibacterium sp. UMB10442]|nr:ATP-grasp domain-containing protein [Brevibacterium sp. UMB10442]